MQIGTKVAGHRSWVSRGAREITRSAILKHEERNKRTVPEAFKLEARDNLGTERPRPSPQRPRPTRPCGKRAAPLRGILASQRVGKRSKARAKASPFRTCLCTEKARRLGPGDLSEGPPQHLPALPRQLLWLAEHLPPGWKLQLLQAVPLPRSGPPVLQLHSASLTFSRFCHALTAARVVVAVAARGTPHAGSSTSPV